MVHFGTPCTMFSRARRDDGGPPPLRSEQFLLGLQGLSELNAEKVRLGNLFLDVTIDLVVCVASAGGHWSIENPAGSMIWLMPQMLALLARVQAARYYLDMCAFSANDHELGSSAGGLREGLPRMLPQTCSHHIAGGSSWPKWQMGLGNETCSSISRSSMHGICKSSSATSRYSRQGAHPA